AKTTNLPVYTRTLFRDSKDRIWVAAGTGIFVFSDTQKLLAFFDYNTKDLTGAISESIVESILETENGTIWLGVDTGGLYSFVEDTTNLQNSYFKKITYFNKKENSNTNYGILFMDMDAHQNIWIRTVSGFLLRYGTKNNTYESFENKEFIKDIKIRTVLVDQSNTLWLGSNNGLHNYNPQTGHLESYYQINGIQGNNFSRRAAYKTVDGKLYFGGDNGLTSFYPTKIKKKESLAKLFINQIKVLNKPIKTVLPEQFTGRIENVKQLQLKSNQSSFSFKFSAVENVLNPNYYYAYRLKGFNNKWITSKVERTATYTNIPSGEYFFEVKAGSKKGLWNIPLKKIKISIAQPLWNRWWAHILYFILASLLIYGILRWIKLKNKLTSEELKRNHDKELYSLKMNFFAKMSHEIQTPLTLISGPIDNMLDRAENTSNTLLNKRLKMISNNVKRLSKIVFELTSIRNKELGILSLRVTKNNLIEDLKEIALSFEEHAEFKKLNFTYNHSVPSLLIWYDKDKFEYIIFNLLSNAFKFTPKGGTVKLTIEVLDAQEQVKITVMDSGPGVAKDELENIFKLFYQSDVGKNNIGSGIGLALTKEIVDLHYGIIDVESSPEKGTNFYVKIPTNKNTFAEIQKNKEIAIKEKPITDSNMVINANSAKKSRGSNPEKTLLIVEDNYELQIFLKDIFNDLYKVVIADDGEEGAALAKKYIPDLIISDIMMPRKDGLEMTELLQKDKMTSHIPIILLTAKETKGSKLRGMQTGAIKYINKPFNVNELLVAVHNIIERSDRIIAKFKKELISSPKKVDAKSYDEEFLEKVVAYINSQLANSNFKVDDLTNVLNMSYSAIYRKFLALTGQKLVNYVKITRIKKATVLFIKYSHSISEAAFSVGFNDPKYFSKCFKKEFQITPVEFKKYAQEKGTDATIREYNLENNIHL
ncbi:MAG: ATP-binding protein, partial [Polaribacter sp.]